MNNKIISVRNTLTAALTSTLGLAGLVVPVLGQELMLEEVVVTAQKRTESVQDIPSTVNVVSGEALQEFSVFSFADVEQLTAGMTLDTSRRQGIVSLRGLSFDPDSAARSAVETYWNEAVVRSGVMFQQVYDIERLEVLRGPQGTLQGRTSPGGAIMMVTRRPSYDTLEGTVQATVADNNGFNTQVGVSLPIIEGELAARIAGVYDESDGGEFENITLGEDLSEDSLGGRLTLGWQPTDTFDATFIYEYMDADGDSQRPIAGSDIRTAPLTPPTPTLGKYDREEITGAIATSIAENKISGLLINWDVGSVRLSSVTNYQDTYRETFEDLDFADALPGVAPARATTDGEIFIQELRLAAADAERWDWLFGLYYQDQKTDTVSDRGVDIVIPIYREEYGIFTHNIIDLSEAFTLQVGLRWQKERAFNRSDVVLASGVEIPLISDENSRRTSEAVTGSLKLQYQLNDEWMLYTSYDRGYRPPGVTIDISGLGEEFILFDEEDSDSIEVGFKSTLWDGRAQVNGAVYYQEFDGFITRKTFLNVDNNGDGIADARQAPGLTYNADAIVTGAEIEGTVLASERWQLGGSVSYVDAKFDDDQSGFCNTFDEEGNPTFTILGESSPDNDIQVSVCDISNLHIGEEPNWSISGNSEYTVPMDSTDWYVRGLYKFTGRRINEDLGEIGGFGVFSLFAGVRSQDGRWDVNIWAKNLFDKEVQTTLFAPEPTSPGYRRVAIIPGQRIGITAIYNFGG